MSLIHDIMKFLIAVKISSMPIVLIGGAIMKLKVLLPKLTVVSSFFLWQAISGLGLLGPTESYAEPAVKLAVLDKMPKAQSAKRFEHLYPLLTSHFREAFANDGRFELIPPEEITRSLKEAGVDMASFDPDDVELLRDIGRRAGADAVFISYYYEMGGHAMPMHSNNVLMLVWVNGQDVVKIDREYSRVLYEDEELISSDNEAFKELLDKTSSQLAPR